MALVYLGIVAVVLPWYLPPQYLLLAEGAQLGGWYVVLVNVLVSARDPLLSGEWIRKMMSEGV